MLRQVYNCQNAHYEWPRFPWLPHPTVSVADVHEWVQMVYPRFGLVGDNPANRCLLALLNLCRGDPYSGPATAWLFNGFESLFCCNPGENRAALTRRISALLEVPDQHVRQVKKSIQALYDLRSAFVHGGLKTLHPLIDEALDKRVEDEFANMMRAVDFGIALMISVLRQLVVRKIKWPVFQEELQS